MSDIDPFQYQTRASVLDSIGFNDRSDIELRDRQLEEYLRTKILRRLVTKTVSTKTITTATRGDLRFNKDTGDTLMYYGATTGWKPLWSYAWGSVDRSPSTAVSATTNGTWVTANTRALAAIPNRRYSCRWSGNVNGATGGEFAQVRVTVDGAVPAGMPASVQTQCPAAAGANTVIAGEVEFVATLTSHIVNLQITRNTGGTQVNLSATVFTISDVGPAGNAPAA